MAPHVQSLYCQIRNRGIIQYFRPYASADMTRMAQSFNTSTSLLENELMNLILDGQIQARIDSHNKILIARNLDERYSIFEKALKMGQDYERKTKFMIVRAAILRAQVAVKVRSAVNAILLFDSLLLEKFKYKLIHSGASKGRIGIERSWHQQ
jgi:COP9 signalosome complex subunit 1